MLRGKIIALFNEQSGLTAAGKRWRKREYVLQTLDMYPRKVFFSIMGDNIDKYPLKLGHLYDIDYDVSSREFQGKWYTDVTVWRVTTVQ